MARAKKSPKKRAGAGSPNKKTTQSPNKQTRPGTQSPSKSQRKGATQADAEPSKKRRCKICQNQPLRASFECRHSKLYKDKLRELLKAGIKASETTHPSELLELWTKLQTSQASVTQPPPATTTSGGSSLEMPLSGPITISTGRVMQSTDGSFRQMTQSALSFDFQNDSQQSIFQTQSSTLNFGKEGVAPVTPQRDSDITSSFDLGSTPSQASFQFPNSNYSGFEVTSTAADEDEDFRAAPTSSLMRPRPMNSNDSSLLPSTSAPVTPIQTPTVAKPRVRVRVSEGFLPYGTVVGAGKGPADWELARSKQLPAAIENSAQSTKRYRNVIKDIVCRCERLGVETGCWLYLAAQHPMAREPFVNFTSRCLVQEYIPKLDELHNMANSLFVSLQSTRRYEAAELAASLKEAQDCAAASLAENNTLHADKQRLDREMQYKDELIQRLQQMHGTALETSN